MIPDTWYYARNCAMRGVLVRVRLAPFVLLRSCGGHIDMMCAVMPTLFRCDATHCSTPFPDVMRMHAYAYQQMHTCLLTPLQSISSL